MEPIGISSSVYLQGACQKVQLVIRQESNMLEELPVDKCINLVVWFGDAQAGHGGHVSNVFASFIEMRLMIKVRFSDTSRSLW